MNKTYTMKLDRAKNTKKNLVFGFFNKFVAIVFPFITRTVIRYTIGVEYLGLSSLFTSILTVLSLAEMGFQSAIVYSMYKPIAMEDYKTINALLALYRRVYRWIGLVVLCVGLFILPFIPKLINGSYPDAVNIYILYIIYLSNTVVSYFLFVYLSSLIAAYQREDIISRNNLLFTVLLNTCQIVIIIFSKNYYLFALLIPVVTVFNNFRIASVAKRMFPFVRCEGELPSEDKKDIRKRVYGLVISKLCITSRNSFDSIFISAFLGLAATAAYNNYYYILSAVTAVLSIVSTSIAAGVGNSVVLETKQKNYEDMEQMNFLYMWISGWATTCLLCLYQPFMKIWMGEDLLLPMHVVILICAYFYVLKMGDIRSVYVQVNGLWWENRYRSVAESFANLFLNYVFVKVWGLTGIVLATLLSLFFINFCYGSKIVFRYYFTEQKAKYYYLQHFLYLGITIVVAAITWRICVLFTYGIVLTIVVRLLICILVPNILYMVLYSKYPVGQRSITWFFRLLKNR